ncbi:hypothetical protein BTO06_09955 [Tenacibaculum sp. SZ-18]|uniref:DUF4373 domain-containing protein n=1 Tax=Tenacibaculum sp. SZ-18 TaxID=754423 RepID=UPI000C2D496C|nr:DUF4373 domain-containing protein [Tenacibaculum sp. SZ-18]AUC15444.1 hypothetical protein BTO06_09955 [Tenacibaculum sp. SZ-18]
MARPIKNGLDYFPFDTDIFSDRKVRKLLKTHGCKGFTVFSLVLCEIYRGKGCFVLCDDDFLFDVSDKLNIAETVVNETINFCVSNGLFNKRVFDCERILTSASIQKRYISAKRGKVVIDTKINVLETETSVNVAITQVNETDSTQSKVKENKVKKSKESTITSNVLKPIEQLSIEYLKNQRVCNAVINNKKNRIQDLTHLKTRIKEFVKTLEERNTLVKTEEDFASHFRNWHLKSKEQKTHNHTDTIPLV